MKRTAVENYYDQLPRLRLSVQRGEGASVAQSEWSVYPRLVMQGAYEEGDTLVLESEEEGVWLWLALDSTLGETLVYLSSALHTYVIPFAEKKTAMNPLAFSGSVHLLTARAARPEEVLQRRCLSVNAYDQHQNASVFPHSLANIETRGEAVFASRNAIDGCHANAGHGPWPYQSWGINRDPEAAFTLDLGIMCAVDELRITIRCDFPHDNYWVAADVVFDDTQRVTLALEKTDLPQVFCLPEAITCRQLRLERLIQAEDPSPFPALTQFEAWGTVRDETF
ncbi:MAG: carbohydrate-binding protein [Clostridia bacterium]|nr:carbohydrate-binding protein [Clostridia bacterium]